MLPPPARRRRIRQRTDLGSPALWLIVRVLARARHRQDFGGHRRRIRLPSGVRCRPSNASEVSWRSIVRPRLANRTGITGKLARDRRLQRCLLLHMTIGDIRLARHQHRRAGRAPCESHRSRCGSSSSSRPGSSRSSDPARQTAAEPLGQRCRGGAAAARPRAGTPFARRRSR